MTSPCLRIVPLEPGDIDALTAVMTRAFDDDSKRHLSVEKGGPPGYDTGEFLRRHGQVRERDDPDGVGSVFVFEKNY